MPDSSGTGDPISTRKRALRADLREQRRALAADERERMDAAINRTIVELAMETADGAIAGFRAFDGEPDLASALAELAGMGRQLVLPVLLEQPTGINLEFRAWDPSLGLTTNRFGIAEPRAGSRVALADISLVLVPLVGWDESGGRLGMGAGYYDRALAEVAGDTRPVRAGIAYMAQQVARIPTDEHDVPLHLVITEHGRFTCPR